MLGTRSRKERDLANNTCTKEMIRMYRYTRRARPRTHFRIIGILTGSEDSRIEFMQNSEF